MFGPRTAFTQLLGLCGFAIAQPLLGILAAHPEFFPAHLLVGWSVVATALGVLVLPALGLFLLEMLVGRLSRRAAESTHLLWIALLGAAILMPVLARLPGVFAAGATTAAALSLAAGGVFAFGCARSGALRSFASFLGAAPLLFLAIFLQNESISRLVAGGPEPVPRTLAFAVDAPAVPVVLVVFDELGTLSLLDGDEQIDGERLPHFAAFAARATWYRNATTVSGYTPKAVPSILTGRLPLPESLPTARDHPANLFSLLGEHYALNVWESATMLGDEPDTISTRARAARIRVLSEDLAVVYAHALLPPAWRGSLPAIQLRWGGFLEGPGGAGLAAVPSRLGDLLRRQGDRARRFRAFVASIDRCPGRCLHYLHSMLPHFPWEYLPSGQRYAPRLQQGLDFPWWVETEWLPLQGQQRHLLQVGFVDRLLGELISHLESLDLFDRALVIVTSDHGAGFEPGGHYRAPSLTAPEQVMRIPLFVKAPHQRLGVVSDRNVEIIDILPTLLELVGADPPEGLDGCSVVDPGCVERVEKVFVDEARMTFEPDMASRVLGLERMQKRFAGGLYAFGPHAGLVGRRLSELVVTRVAPMRFVREKSTGPLGDGFADVRVRGLLAPVGSEVSLQLAVVTEAVVRTVVPALLDTADFARVDALIPERVGHSGEGHRARLFWVRGEPGRERLRPIPETVPR